MTPLLSSFIVFHLFRVVSASYTDAYELETLLFTNYSTRIRPVEDFSQPITVNCAFEVVTIVSVDEMQGQLTIIGGLVMEWVDEKLQWNPSDHGGITYLNPYPKDVWRPRIQLLNSLQNLDVFGDNYDALVLQNSGQVTWRPTGVLSSLCFLNLKQFPFDKHSCELFFQPMFTTQGNINFAAITIQGVNRQRYAENGEWILKTASVQARYFQFSSSTALMVTMDIERRPEFFLINFFVPVVLLSILNLLSFTMVVSDGSVNIGYSITVLLAYTIYMSILIDHLPSVSMNMPFLAYYLFILFTMSILITVDIIFIVWLNNKEEEEEKKQKVESKVKGAMTKLLSLKAFRKNQISSSEKPHDPSTQKSTPTSVINAWQIQREKDLSDKGKNIPLTITSDDDYIRNRPSRVNKYKNLSEKVRIYSLYTFIILNTVTFCVTCVILIS